MRDCLKFILFLLYVVGIFFLQDYALLLVVFFLNILAMVIVKIDIIDSIKNLLGIGILVLLTTIINLFLDSFSNAILIAVKLLLVCNITYTFSKILTPTKLANVIERFCYPLKIFKVNPKDIGLMIAIMFSFFPILKQELLQIRYSLKSKGYQLKWTNLNCILVPLLLSSMKKVNDIEDSLKSKAYIE